MNALSPFALHLLGRIALPLCPASTLRPGDRLCDAAPTRNGNPYAIPDIQTLRELRDIHLVVLSACETGLGGADGLGLEIAGMSSFFLGDRDRAKAVMASLWNVNDASTSLMMQQFYKHLASGMTKAEALKTVQQEFIDGKVTAQDAPRRSGDAEIKVTTSGTRTPRPANFSHPYYWAPFILIGNSL